MAQTIWAATYALDVTIQAQILELMKMLKTKHRTFLLMSSHNLGIISEQCEKVTVMYAGRIIEYGSVHEVFRDPRHDTAQRGPLCGLRRLQ